MQTNINIFFAYAQKDKRLRDKLEQHLAPLLQKQMVVSWSDQCILPGKTWANEVSTHLEQADVILLLVSAAFLSSKYCYSIEMTKALEKERNGSARVIPVILRHVAWQDAPFSHLQALPTLAKPVVGGWRTQDEAFTDIAQGIRKVVEELLSRSIEQNNVGTTIINKRSSSLLSDHPGEEPYYSPSRYPQGVKIKPTTFWTSHKIMGSIAILWVVVIVLVLVVVWLLSTVSPNPTRGSAAVPVTATPTPMPTATPTPTPTAALPCIVNVGTWMGGSADWVARDGLLYNDGTNESPPSSGPTILAPCQPGMQNYAVETKIQVINQSGGCFGLVLRGTSGPKGWQGYRAGVCGPNVRQPNTAYIMAYGDDKDLAETLFKPGTSMHTYRAEVKNNTIKLFIDGSLIIAC